MIASALFFIASAVFMFVANNKTGIPMKQIFWVYSGGTFVIAHILLLKEMLPC